MARPSLSEIDCMLPRPMLLRVDFETWSAAEAEATMLTITTNAPHTIPKFFIVVSS